jgi:eukaryotic-like serine/threonine-protein kinase
VGMKKFLKKLFPGKPKVKKTDLTRRFDLIGRVGQGTMSRVWRARDTMSGRMVALKVLDKEKTKKYESRFSPELNKPSEGEVAVTLRHPNIVTTYEWGLSREGEQFLMMEFVEGIVLSYLVDVQNDRMKRNRLWYIIQIGEGLQYLHQQKWIYRDCCPRNILVTQDDEIKLIDFGLVVPNTPPFQAPGNRTGTANYMAPELVKRQKTDERIDIYSYAMTCYEMYAKRFPWEGEAESLDMIMQHINTPPTPIETIVPEIDSQIGETIMKGLKVHPDDRWQTVSEMLRQFRLARKRLEGVDEEEREEEE